MFSDGVLPAPTPEIAAFPGPAIPVGSAFHALVAAADIVTERIPGAGAVGIGDAFGAGVADAVASRVGRVAVRIIRTFDALIVENIAGGSRASAMLIVDAFDTNVINGAAGQFGRICAMAVFPTFNTVFVDRIAIRGRRRAVGVG